MSNHKPQIDIERRTWSIEVRKADTDSVKRVGGLAAVFETLTPIGWFLEGVKKGAFDTAEMAETVALFNHDTDLVLGRTSAGTLRLNITDAGLDYEADLPDTTTGSDVYALVSRGDVKQSSFGFTIRKQTWESVQRATLAGQVPDEVLDRVSYGGMVDIRNIEEIGTLYDVSPVTFPAYADTTAAKRCRDEALGQRSLPVGIVSNSEEIVNENVIQRLDRWLKLAKIQ